MTWERAAMAGERFEEQVLDRLVLLGTIHDPASSENWAVSSHWG